MCHCNLDLLGWWWDLKSISFHLNFRHSLLWWLKTMTLPTHLTSLTHKISSSTFFSLFLCVKETATLRMLYFHWRQFSSFSSTRSRKVSQFWGINITHTHMRSVENSDENSSLRFFLVLFCCSEKISNSQTLCADVI